MESWLALYLVVTAIVITPFAIAGVGVAATVWWLVLRVLRHRARLDALLETGLPATAEVLALEPLGAKSLGREMVQMRARVQPDVGAAFELDSVQLIHPVYLGRVQPGARVEVRYAPDGPEGPACMAVAL